MIEFASFDVAFANLGMVRGVIKEDGTIVPNDCKLVNTFDQRDVSAKKTTRKSSEELRRARELVAAMQAWAFGCTIAFAEVPSGSQSASAGRALGIAVGCLASCPVPVIEVTQLEVKLASVGKKGASKAEMLAWAFDKAPHLPWGMRKSLAAGGMIPTLQNEHCADALATVYAGVKTPDFRRLLELMKHASQTPDDFKPTPLQVDVPRLIESPGMHRRVDVTRRRLKL